MSSSRPRPFELGARGYGVVAAGLATLAVLSLAFGIHLVLVTGARHLFEWVLIGAGAVVLVLAAGSALVAKDLCSPG